MLRAVARIDAGAIERNCARLKDVAGTRLCVVVKANGYGHGALTAARAAQRGGADWLAVATAGEAAELRDGGIEGRILVMGALSVEETPIALGAGADVVAWRAAFLERLPDDASVHVKLDTGMGRLGTRDREEALAVAAQAHQRGMLAGAMTHFATADDDPAFAREQLDAFRSFAEAMPDGVIRHAANSAATLGIPESRLDMVRCGIAAYGLDPFQRDPADHGLEPALTLASYVAEVKPVEPGQSAGYGRRFVAEAPTTLATLPIGYADGVRRALTNNADVLIGGRRCPLAGTVSMDNLTVEAPGAQRGEEAILIGAQGGERILAEEWARRLGTINYEITCGISARVPGMLDALRAALAGERAWIVGGAVRDRLLGRDTDDFDVALDGDPQRAAKALRGAVGGAAFPLSKTFGGWRVVTDRGSVDLLPLTGGTLEADLAARDFTVNAMAEPAGGGELIDPHGGAADLEARRLRPVSATSFTADPLRVLRLVRLAAELGFEPETELAVAAAPGLSGVAAERIFAEFKRIVCSPSPSAAVRLMDTVGATAVILPELRALQGIGQSVYHDADVYDHTLAVLDEAARLEDAEEDPRVRTVLSEPLADDLTRWQGLRFAALLHDIAKPDTSRQRNDGRGASFVGHDQAGAALARDVLRRLRASERLAEHTAALTLHHLRVGFLVHEQPLQRRSVHRYLQTTAPWTVDVTVFTCADRLATRGRNAEQATAAHLDRARELLEHAFAARPPEPLVRGDELARELDIRPGPRLGELLARLEEDRFAGEISTRDEALARARQYLAANA